MPEATQTAFPTPNPGITITGRRRLAGFTDQANGAVKPWKFSWFQPDGITQVNMNGLLVPLSGSIKHSADVKRLKDGRGNTVTVLATDEIVTIEIVATPDAVPTPGTPNTAGLLAWVLESATFPQPNGWVTIADAPVMNMGTFVNVFNGANWMYNSDGSIELASDNEWGMRFSLTKFANLTLTSAVYV